MTKLKGQARVVRSLHLPVETDVKICRAAGLSGESVAAFIREAAERRAEKLLGDGETAIAA